MQTGCGRTGTWYAFEQYGIEPDVIIASKGLSGLGLPVSVILYRSRLDRWGPGSHIGTFRGNNLAFASGNAYLEVLRRENLLDNVRAQGRHLLTGAGRPAAVHQPDQRRTRARADRSAWRWPPIRPRR